MITSIAILINSSRRLSSVDAFKRREFVVGIELRATVAVIEMTIARRVIIRITVMRSAIENNERLIRN